jgi:hypothetical protein
MHVVIAPQHSLLRPLLRLRLLHPLLPLKQAQEQAG